MRIVIRHDNLPFDNARCPHIGLKEDRSLRADFVRWARPSPRTGCALITEADCNSSSCTSPIQGYLAPGWYSRSL